MRELLLGYLLDALDADEQGQVATAVATDQALWSDLRRLALALGPLASDRESFAPPNGLAARTCAAVAAYGEDGRRGIQALC